MEAVSIAEEFFYAKKLYTVIRGKNRNHYKITEVIGRHSDAFVYVLAGTCTYSFENRQTVTVKPGDILYLAHRANYSMKVHEEVYRYIYVDFEFDSERERSCEVFNPEASKSTEHLFVKLLNTYHSDAFSAYAEQLSIFYMIYETVLKSKTPHTANSSLVTRLEKAKHYMDRHFADINMTIPYLAEMSGMSEVYFRKIFKREYGHSPSQYLVTVRLQNAVELMKYPFITLEECARQSGFSSCQYFSRVFQKNMGISPAKYRKSQKS